MKKTKQSKTRVLIMGAAGFDYHVFNMCFRDDAESEVVAFSFCGEQNLGTSHADTPERRYPPDLAGKYYPKGIRFIPEASLAEFIRKENIEKVVFAYSDISHEELMHRASIALAAGSDFTIIAPKKVQLQSTKPVISICAVRTGVGKSSVAKACVRYFQSRGKRAVGVREPMPYGNLSKQACMRFATMQDLIDHDCTVEEREEYEPYVQSGLVIFSGVDYEKVIRAAEAEADVIIWDGGNNEISFFVSQLLLVLADPLRSGHETRYHPGEANCRMADAFVLTKCHEASLVDIANVEHALQGMSKHPNLPVVHVGSTTRFEFPDKDLALVKDKCVVVVDDGPTLTHGSTSFGAGFVLAKKFNLDIVNPKPNAVGSYRDIFNEFPHLNQVVPAMGYNNEQLDDLAATLNRSGAEVVVNGSPSDLKSLLGDRLKLPIVRVLYDVMTMPHSKTSLEDLLLSFALKHGV